jgi:deazaflavin-dependent oxidoreductase (nitroreductase family)
MADFNQQIIDEFRANHGKVGGGFAGAPMIILTTTGAKSGKPHTNPVVYLEDGDRVFIFGSKAGAPTSPDWYHNLVANPRVTVERGSETYAADAVVITGEERNRLFAAQAAVMPGFADYQAKTSRVIPVVELRRVREAA